MINKKWLRISLFIPIFGTVINFLMIFLKSNGKAKGITLGMAICSLFFFIGFVVFTLLLRFILNILGLQLENSQLGVHIVFIPTGILMNWIFLKYYNQNYLNIN